MNWVTLTSLKFRPTPEWNSQQKRQLRFINDMQTIGYLHRGGDNVQGGSWIKDPEWPSGLVPAHHAGAPGSLPGRVGLSEINFSDLYCGWLGRIINVEYNTTHNTTQYTGARWFGGMFGALQLEGCGFESTSKSPRRDPGQVLHSQLLMRFGVKLRFSVRAVVGSASE